LVVLLSKLICFEKVFTGISVEELLFKVLFTRAATPITPRRKIRKNNNDILEDLLKIITFFTKLRGIFTGNLLGNGNMNLRNF